ncbi:MAG: hypothetical protein IID18_07575 [Nitrospinae bacterium]|nr:hypothetical protein [Nitrospinota bacterium]
MKPHEAPHLPHAADQWVEWFRDGTVNSDLDDTEVRSILHYLADLELLEPDGEGTWKLSGIESGQSGEDARRSLRDRLDVLSASDRGFALVYFLPRSDDKPLPSLESPGSPAADPRKKSLFGKSTAPETKTSSDLSNLQIVKKWKNQLRPFLDLEQKTIARLKGKHTTGEDAQRLFSYILEKIRKKAPPKEWEQLSRKRHR